MSKAVSKKQSTELVEASPWDDAFSIEAQDIQIPKILLMQGLSKYVASEDAQMGDIVHGGTAELLGSGREKAKKAVLILPIMSYKEWANYEMIGGKRDFMSIEPFTAANATQPLSETVDGKEISRDLVMSFFVMLIERDSSLPFVISFRRTSLRCGKEINSHILDLRGRELPPVEHVLELGGVKRENDDGTFYVWDFKVGRKATDEEKTKALSMLKLLRQSEVRVDNSDIVEGEEKSEETEF